MTEKAGKGKSGAGKFILGARLGGIARAIAGKFIKLDSDGGEEIEDNECDGDGECVCDGESKCKKEEVKEEVKKPVAKKTSEKK